MLLKRTKVKVRLVTILNLAFIFHSLRIVNLYMLLEVAFRGESFRTMRTSVGFVPVMNLFMSN